MAKTGPEDGVAVISLSSGYAASHAADRLKSCTESLILFIFEGSEEEGFGPDEAELGKALAALPAAGRLSLAYTNGFVCGRDLALLLRCSLVTAGPAATFGSGFGRPAAAAIYAAAATRIGAIAAERSLFAAKPQSAEGACKAGLAWLAHDPGEASTIGKQRFSTMLSVAKANLITWPFIPEAEQALIDVRV